MSGRVGPPSIHTGGGKNDNLVNEMGYTKDEILKPFTEIESIECWRNF